MPEKRSKSPRKMNHIEFAELVSKSITDKPSLKDKIKKTKERVARLKYLKEQNITKRDAKMLRDIEEHKAQIEMERERKIKKLNKTLAAVLEDEMIKHPELETFNAIERSRVLAKLVQDAQIPMFVRATKIAEGKRSVSTVTNSNVVSTRRNSSDGSENENKRKMQQKEEEPTILKKHIKFNQSKIILKSGQIDSYINKILKLH